MSLYNMLFGVNKTATVLLELLNSVHPINPPRFRDCYFDGENIIVYTRTGGGNRDYYESEESCRANYPEYFTNTDDDPSGPWNNDMRVHPWYSHDDDDEFDSTYANFYFVPPTNIAHTLVISDITPEQKWKMLLEMINKS